MSEQTVVTRRIPLLSTARQGWALALECRGGWLTIAVALQSVVILVAAPLLYFAAVGALHAAGIASLTTTTISRLVRSPLGIAIVVTVLLLVVLAVTAQAVLLLMVAGMQRNDPERRLPGLKAVWRKGVVRLGGLLRRPSSLLLVPYLLILIPLGQVGLGSALTSWIAIPPFISGELTKTTVGAISYSVVMLLIWYLNIRLLLVLPIISNSEHTVASAIRLSWVATRWQSWRVLLLTILVSVPLLVGGFLLIAVSLAIVALGEVLAPQLAPGIAAATVGIAQVLIFFGFAFTAAVQAQVFVGAGLASGVIDSAAQTLKSAPPPPRTRRILAVSLVATATAASVVLAIAWFPTIDRLDDGATVILAHRGYTADAVENTVPALEAAAAAGADLVEFDVQQTRDGDWVVMHDFDLERLTGRQGSVANLSLAEATALIVRSGSHQAPVPSMREFVRRAAELGMPLLIEIKPHGGETSDYLQRFFEVLDEEGVTDTSLYHSLSEQVVEGQQALRPDLVVGLIVPLNLGGVPETSADFVVIEEWSYTPELQDQIQGSGRGLLVWTVNDESAMRRFLRAEVDGIISDQVSAAIDERTDIAEDRSLVSRLFDVFQRLTFVF